MDDPDYVYHSSKKLDGSGVKQNENNKEYHATEELIMSIKKIMKDDSLQRNSSKKNSSYLNPNLNSEDEYRFSVNSPDYYNSLLVNGGNAPTNPTSGKTQQNNIYNDNMYDEYIRINMINDIASNRNSFKESILNPIREINQKDHGSKSINISDSKKKSSSLKNVHKSCDNINRSRDSSFIGTSVIVNNNTYNINVKNHDDENTKQICSNKISKEKPESIQINPYSDEKCMLKSNLLIPPTYPSKTLTIKEKNKKNMNLFTDFNRENKENQFKKTTLANYTATPCFSITKKPEDCANDSFVNISNTIPGIIQPQLSSDRNTKNMNCLESRSKDKNYEKNIESSAEKITVKAKLAMNSGGKNVSSAMYIDDYNRKGPSYESPLLQKRTKSNLTMSKNK